MKGTTKEKRVVFRCRKCRFSLLIYPDNSLLSAHGHLLNLKDNSNSCKIEFNDLTPELVQLKCASFSQDVFYIQEVNIPQWMTSCINRGGWTKGKLTCPECSARLGSFNFVSGFHCACQQSVVPSIHLVKSKIDFSFSEISSS